MAHEFVHMGWSAGSSLFGHGNWVGDCDMTQAYAWHKRLLQVLQWKLPNERWVLKAPVHLFGLGALLETYPDARIVFTHRDPVGSMEKIYGHFDILFSRTARRRMQVWLRDNPRSKFGSHACNAAELGLDPDRENERFGFYVNRLNRTGGDA